MLSSLSVSRSEAVPRVGAPRTAYWLLFLVAAASMLFREVAFFTSPRVWAEEAIYLVRAHEHGLLDALLQTRAGYLSLWTNVVAAIATRWGAIENWALFTTLAAAIVQLVTVAMVVWNRSSLFRPMWRRAAALLIVLLAPLSGEVWLNTINSQFYFSLTTLLVLLDCEGGYSPAIHLRNLALLSMAGLTGVPSLFLFPLYVHAAWVTRDKHLRLEAAVLGAAGIAQAYVLATSIGAMQSDRPLGGGAALVPMALLVKSVALPLAGVANADRLGVTLTEALSSDPDVFAALAAACGALGLAILALLARGEQTRTGWYLAAAYILLAAPSALFALGPKTTLLNATGAQRYFYVPNAITMLLLLANLPPTVLHRRWQWREAICLLTLAATLIVSTVSYRDALFTNPAWPSWREEIERWRGDPAYTITIWPGWTFNLDP
jgi:hypothetical protein